MVLSIVMTVILIFLIFANFLLQIHAAQCGIFGGLNLGECPSFAPCCSQYGWCGTTKEYCAPSFKCQSNCWKSEEKPDEIVAPATDMDANDMGWSDSRGMFDSCKIKGVVSLTYDDGPSLYTTNLLRYLAAAKVKATFFVLGENLLNPAKAAAVVAAYKQGHIIASHTWSHTSLISLSNQQIKDELNRTSDLIFKLIRVRPRYMRPPYGDVNERVVKLVTSLGYRIIMWNTDTHDWRDKNQFLIIDSFVQNLRTFAPYYNQKSLIVLQHDTYDFTVESQPQVLDIIVKSPFRVVDIHECLGENAAPYYYF